MGQFNAADRWITIAEGYASRGDTRSAAGVLGSAVREHPTDAFLWVGYGNALVDHAGTLTPGGALGLSPARPSSRRTTPRRASSSASRWPARAIATARWRFGSRSSPPRPPTPAGARSIEGGIAALEPKP